MKTIFINTFADKNLAVGSKGMRPVRGNNKEILSGIPPSGPSILDYTPIVGGNWDVPSSPVLVDFETLYKTRFYDDGEGNKGVFFRAFMRTGGTYRISCETNKTLIDFVAPQAGLAYWKPSRWATVPPLIPITYQDEYNEDVIPWWEPHNYKLNVLEGMVWVGGRRVAIEADETGYWVFAFINWNS